jgi:hypothetical protein
MTAAMAVRAGPRYRGSAVQGPWTMRPARKRNQALARTERRRDGPASLRPAARPLPWMISHPRQQS